MAEPAGLFLLLLLAVQQRGGQGQEPGSGPSCDRCDLRLSCDCSCDGFRRVPAVTERALTLDLSFNDIAAVTGVDLRGHRRLRWLSLHGNRVSAIDPSAFDSLWSLEELDLSSNRLTTLRREWFHHLGALQSLNLLDNPYRCVGSTPVFRGLVRLRRLALGGAALREIQRGALSGITRLDALTIRANQLSRYEPGALSDVWPLGRVSLSLGGPMSGDAALASAVLRDVSYPDTRLVLRDLNLVGNRSVQPLREVARSRVRSLTLRNLSTSDEAVVTFMEIFNGAPLTTLCLDGATLTGNGKWAKASWTDLKSIDELWVRNVVVLDIWSFVSFLELKFLLQFPRKISVINSKVFVTPCQTTGLLLNLQYLDLSDNLLTDLTLTETLCEGNGTLKDLRVLNVSGNPLKSLSTMSRLVAKLHKLTHLEVSGTRYGSMPRSCSWPPNLRHLNISGAKLTGATSCLPATLEVLDLSYNYLRDLRVALPVLRELRLSGNRFLRLPSGALFPNLQTLCVQSNAINEFRRSDLGAFPRLRDLRAGHNKFACSCDFVAFLQSGVDGGRDVRLTDGRESYVCDSPLALQGEPVVQVRLSVLACHRVLVVSLGCGVALFAGILFAVLLWRLHALWYVQMMWAWLKAKRGARQRRRRRRRHRGVRAGEGSEALLAFDAFVSYSEKDAGWVENYLVPELEEPGGSRRDPAPPLTLCLHKRDFLPGRWIEDNIIEAVERSRRTVFVLSENFVRSDWCRYELDFSHFWLFEGAGGGEPAILVLLEPLSRDDVPRRFCKLRKLMSSTTYLEWPQEEERRPEFWRSLRRSLGPGEDR